MYTSLITENKSYSIILCFSYGGKNSNMLVFEMNLYNFADVRCGHSNTYVYLDWVRRYLYHSTFIVH